MSILDRLLPDFTEDQRGERNRLLGLMAMFFLVVTAVGILKPVKNSLALSGLGDNEFYKVYLVSAVVLLFVPVYNRLADRIGWRRLVPAVAIFFALNLLLFRIAYSEGSTVLGLTFYGWYDLFGAALVTQFFVATQMFLTARTARSAYPLVIGGGALGAVLGGGIAALLADRIGTPNLLLVAAVFVLVFGIGLTFTWPKTEPSALERDRARGLHRRETVTRGDLRRVLGNPHVRLIGASVLLAILVKQLVDYQFNTLSERIFVTQDAITQFQGTVNVFTQWLPLLSVVALRPLLRRWGIGLAVFLLPGLMLATGLVMAALFSIWTVIAVRASDTMFRYSAERAGREILYVPVPEDIKLKAKTYIDVGVEKGLGKALSAVLVFLLVEWLGLDLRELAYVAVALAVGWLALTVAIRREYVRTLARSIRGRFASFEGLSALSDASTQGVVQRALRGDDPVQTSFALDLVDQSAGTGTGPISEALHDLLDHRSQEIRRKALALLTGDPASIDEARVRRRLLDPARPVREQAVLALAAAHEGDRDVIIRELLASEDARIRAATLACLARGEIDGRADELLGPSYFEERLVRAQSGEREARIELALAAGALRDDPRAIGLLEPFLGDPDPAVAAAAIRSAGMLHRPELHPALIAGLRAPSTREAAREALAEQGALAVGVLADYLLDDTGHPVIRRHIPSVLARIPEQKAVDVMLHSVIAPETDQILDFRTLKALSKLRLSHSELVFDPELVLGAVEREVRAAERYDRARRCLRRVHASAPTALLLVQSLDDAWLERQEGVFRLLGLLYPPAEMYRAFLAIAGGEWSSRGNALEWLEETVGHRTFEMLGPILGEGPAAPTVAMLEESLWPLLDDGDVWIARLTISSTAELAEPWSGDALRSIIETGSVDELCDLARRLLEARPPDALSGNRMDLIEKVFLLQKIDLLRGARSSHLALLASIAEEVDAEPGTILIRQEEPTDALYIVIDGAVDLEGVGGHVLTAEDGQAFGTWALIDEAPSLVTATVRGPTRLLRITRLDFHDLLADHAELALGLLQGLARRVRTLVA